MYVAGGRDVAGELEDVQYLGVVGTVTEDVQATASSEVIA